MKKIFLTLCCYAITFFAFAQSQNQAPALMNVIPPSPTAAALGKYGEIPVSLYTGVPNISIPLYEINEGDIRLPISLSYHASGIKAEDAASWVGLGWSLNAGGVITRSIRGKADDINLGYIGNQQKIKQYLEGSLSPLDKYYMESAASKGEFDTEPDVFFFNFGGYSGKFVMTDKDIFIIPKQNLKIEKIALHLNEGFKVTTDGGVIYVFDVIERGGGEAEADLPVNAWYVSSITKDNHYVSFSYDDYINYSFPRWSVTDQHAIPVVLQNSGGGSSQDILLNCQNPIQFQSSTLRYEAKRLSKIETSSLEIIFVPSTQFREDVKINVPLFENRCLQEIKIKSNLNNLAKHYKMTYSYYGGTTRETKRLRLDKISSIISNEIHSFDYHDFTVLPTPANQDHWGYLAKTNSTSNTILLPETIGRIGEFLYYLPGINRDAQAVGYQQSGTLKKITYPTKGYSTFEYETHDYHKEGTKYIQETKSAYAYYNNEDDEVQEHKTVFELYYDTHVQFTGTISTKGAVPDLYYTAINCRSITTGKRIWGTGDAGVTISPRMALKAGRYELVATVDKIANEKASIFIAYNAEVPLDVTSINEVKPIVGGLRIKQIMHHDGVGNESKKNFEYLQENNRFSSGILFFKPQYVYEESVLVGVDPTPGSTSSNCNTLCRRLVRHTYSLSPLGSTQGSHIGYRRITEFNTSNGEQGKTITTYNCDPLPDLSDRGLPFVYDNDVDFLRGTVYKSTHYKKAAIGFLPISQTEFEYSGSGTNKYLIGLKIGMITSVDNNCQTTNPLTDYEFRKRTYHHYSQWTYPVKKIERIYGQGSTATQYIETITNYNYENSVHGLLTHSSTIDSKQIVLGSRTKYPLDYTFTTQPITQDFAKGIKLLQDKHILVPVIEQLQTKTIGNTTYITGGSLVEYHPDKPFQKSIWVLELEDPILDTESNFTKSKIDANNNFIYDSRYVKRINFDTFDEKGNLLQQNKTDDITQAYIWGYNKTMPIAQVINANKDEIFYTSFEEATTGGTIIDDEPQAKTGSKYFNGTYQLPNITTVAGKNYVLTYFQFENNEWKYKKIDYVANTSLTGIIDEVRIYPEGALMTTLTYTPLIGKTSETDTNGITTYYEYDSANRLKFIKDQDKNIIQRFTYKYAE